MKRPSRRPSSNRAARPSTAAPRPGDSALARTRPSPQAWGAIAPLLPALLIAATLLAYQPVWNAGFIWDDDDYVTQNQTLRDLDGLRRIWFEVGAVPQYYPLVHTVFWVEYHLWGLHPLGYHLVNVLLHALAAILLARLLLRLRIPGAWLAAFLFALHPVGVESAAWVTELKNVLSAVFYLAAALAYCRFAGPPDSGFPLWQRGSEGDFPQDPISKIPPDPPLPKGGTRTPENIDGPREWGWYAAALVLYVAALFSKTVTCTLPAALLLIRWWQTGRLRAADVWPLLPFFALGAGLGLQTAAIEKHSVGALGAKWSLSFAERCLIAARAVWFYAGKLLWPINLTFIYPRWSISTAVWWQWLFPAATVGLLVALWLTRQRIGRGPLVAVLFFIGTLGPALGFINVYPMRYSFVADHFQYLASIGLIALAAAGLATWFASRKPRQPLLEGVVCTVLLSILALLTWRQTAMYTDLETLWRTTIARNPQASIAHNNLGNLLLARGQSEEAAMRFQSAVQLEPDNAEARDSLGTALLERGQVDEAMVHFQKALELAPHHARTHYNLGTAFLRKGRVDEAIARLQRAVEIQPVNPLAHNNLGNAYFTKGEMDEAIAHYRAALQSSPDLAEASNNLGSALVRSGRLDEAAAQYLTTLKAHPDFAEAQNNLRSVAWTLATSRDASARSGARAIALALEADRLSGGANPVFKATLAAAYAEAGRFADAIATAQRALQLAQDHLEFANEVRAQIALYETGQPYRAE